MTHMHCDICPRACRAIHRTAAQGFCRTGERLSVASVCLHRGEEPVITGRSGICNIFFYHCNLQCVYCQNYQISNNSVPVSDALLEFVIDTVSKMLDAGVKCVGFVSPSHMISQMREIIHGINATGRRPVYVMNTNAYDRPEKLASLDGVIDVYLPDFKYMESDLAREFSGAGNYPGVGVRALREMYRQKGSNILCDDEGAITSGMIIRHLILPGHVENSKKCLRAIAEELSTSVHVSLMSQYYPVPAVKHHATLGRTITREEYEEVLDEFYRLGFYRGWVQEFGSAGNYLPDFARDEPFG